MKLFTRCALLLTVLALPLVSATAATVTVTIGDNFYSPAAVTLNTGDIVHFVWQSGVHPTTSDSPAPAWATFTLSATNSTKDITFNTAGTYPYHCDFHGFPGGGMSGTITVRSTASAAANPHLTLEAVSIFPNPSRGQVTVQLAQKAGPDYKLRLSNIIGQEVRTIALKPELTAAGLPLDLSDLRAGVYFYSLVVDGKVVATKRLVLQN